MPFSAYYNNSKRSGRSRRFRVTSDSGERNLWLARWLAGWLAGWSGGGASGFGSQTWYFLCFIGISAQNVAKRTFFFFSVLEKGAVLRLLY